MEFECDNCKRMRTGECAGLTRSCQGFVPLQRVDPEILKAAQEAHDNRMHKENYYGSRNTQKREEAVEKAQAERQKQEPQVKAEPVRQQTAQKDAAPVLRAWRRAQANAENIPAYCVFPDTTLNALASARIRCKKDLLDVRGIGARLFEKYGDDLFEILSDFN